jgi:hypothetical protein
MEKSARFKPKKETTDIKMTTDKTAETFFVNDPIV